ADEIGRQLVEQDERRLVANHVGPGGWPWLLARTSPMRFAAQVAEDALPKVLTHVRLATGERRHTDRAVVDAHSQSAQDDLAHVGIAGEERSGEQVVGLAATHGLLQSVDALVALARQALEDLAQERSHALCDVRLREELLGVQARQICNLSDRLSSLP